MKFTKFAALVLALMMCILPAVAENAEEAFVTVNPGKLTISTNAEFAPWEMVGEDGYIGVDMEIAAMIADELGLELDVQNVEFNSVINMVTSNKADMAISGITITPERQESVLFSVPYATAVQSIIVKEGYDKITCVDDLVGKVVGVQMSTTGDFFVSDMEGVEVRQYSSGTNAALDLAAGRIDAVMIDSAPAETIVSNIEGLVILEGIDMEPESYGIAFQLENEALAAKINPILDRMIKDGTITALYLKYTVNEEVETVNPGKLTVATNAEFAPWEMVGEGGDYIGVDMDMVRLMALELGLELDVQNVEFNSVINMVTSNKADMAISGITITPERQESVLFSTPYATAVQSIIVKEGYDKITCVDDLVGKVVGVQLSTTGDFFVSDMEGVEVRQYSTGTNAALDLAAGRIDAVMIDSAPAEAIVSNIDGLVILEGIEMEPELYGIAFQLENTALCNRINTIIERLINDGIIDNLYIKYTVGEAAE